MPSRWGIQSGTQLEGNPLIDRNDKLKSQIMVNIGEDSFTLLHSNDLDLLEVYLVLSAALAYIEDEAESLSRNEGSYLQ
jgi:hypothetical protein